MNADHSLPLDSPREAALLHAAEIIAKSWRSFDRFRPEQPTLSRQTLALAGLGLPELPTGVLHAMDEAERILDESLTQSRPRFFAFIGSSALEVAVLGDVLAAAHDVNLAMSSRAADLIEEQTGRWLAELVGYPAAAGYCTSGGMVSNLTALTAARERALPGARRHGLKGRRLAVYCSQEAHASIERAAEILGIGGENVRGIRIDADRRMDTGDLARQIAADRAAGILPMAVVATAGTTLTGAVDPLDAVAGVCAEYGVWMHVDGAYGLAAASIGMVRDRFRGLERADSASVDAHKWLYVPKACGWLLVRDQAALSAAFAHESQYMPHDEIVPEAHPVDYTLEYSRPFRALKLWLALRTHGAAAFRHAVDRNLRQARLLADLVRAAPDMELMCEPTLSVVPFRHLPRHGDPDAHNRKLALALQNDGRFWLSHAVIDGVTCLRPCLVNFRTTQDDVRDLIEVTREIAGRL